ncbi:MAG TPA: sensor domain-containing diguanylate cyclase, partial [Mycobacteriales bacterium]|nr:sensor domain-containing diguanylate cyclase [Mycobacteriales bacterium]
MSDGGADAEQRRLDPREIEARLNDVLDRPESFALAGINHHGLFVPLPPTVDLRHHRALTGYASALDLVVAEDATAVIELWERALATGAASGEARLARAAGHPVMLHVFDTTPRHGIYLGVVDISASAEVALDGGDNPALRPRVGWLRKDQLAVVVEVDDAVSLMLGWTREQLLTTRTLDFLDPDDHTLAISSWMSMLAEPGSRRRVRLRHRHADGSWRWFDVTNHNRLNDPAHGDVLTEMVDVTDEMEAQEALRSRENLLRRLTETLPVGLLQFDRDLHVLYRNDRLGEMLGERHGATVPDLLDALPDGDREALLAQLRGLLTDGADRGVEVAVCVDGATRRFTVALRALCDDAEVPTGGIACLTDVTESVELREQLADRATYDALTRCQNRASILATLQQRLDLEAARGVAVVFVDLDRFKAVNDEFGHVVGDQVLVEAARRLTTGVRGDDAVGRL